MSLRRAEKPTCLTCPYWDEMDSDEEVPVDPGYHEGWCLRYPPGLVVRDADSRGDAHFDPDHWDNPVTLGFQTCGEHPDMPAWLARRRRSRKGPMAALTHPAEVPRRPEPAEGQTSPLPNSVP